MQKRRVHSAMAADGAEELIVDEWLAERGGKRPRLGKNELKRDSLKFGWIDVVLNSSDGTFLGVHAQGHDSRFGKDARPQADASDLLAPQWRDGDPGVIRVTFRMLTSAHMLTWLRDPFAYHRRPTRPHVEVYEVGSWDHARNVFDPDGFVRPLRDFLRTWVASATSDAARPRPTLVYATMPRAFEALDACRDGSYEQDLVSGLVPHVLNRVRAHEDLKRDIGDAGACPCAAKDDYHPPSLQNLWDVQRLLNMILPKHKLPPPSTTLHLDPPGFASCCCAPPDASRATGQIAHWARVCRPQEAPPRSAQVTTHAP